MQIILKEVPLAFPSIFDPKRVGADGAMRYSAAFPIEPNSVNDKQIRKAVSEACIAQWGDQAKSVLVKLSGDNRVCYKQKELTDKEGATYNGFEGRHALNASNGSKPHAVGLDKKPLDPVDRVLYAGAIVNAIVDIWAQDNAWGRRVNCTLGAVQFVRDGEPLGGATPVDVDESFEDLSGEGVQTDFEEDFSDLT